MQAARHGAAVQDVEGDGPGDHEVEAWRHGQDVGQEARCLNCEGGSVNSKSVSSQVMASKEGRMKWVLGGLISVHIVFNKISMLLVTYVILNIVSIILCTNLQENFI